MRKNINSIISVIIPTYNYGRYLPQAVDSVLNQTYKNFEIIVVDDGSTDNTKEVLKPYKGLIHYIHQNNKGLPSAYNTGLRASHGGFIAFLDSDDMWLPEKLMNIHKSIARYGDFAIHQHNLKIMRNDIITEEK